MYMNTSSPFDSPCILSLSTSSFPLRFLFVFSWFPRTTWSCTMVGSVEGSDRRFWGGEEWAARCAGPNDGDELKGASGHEGGGGGDAGQVRRVGPKVRPHVHHVHGFKQMLNRFIDLYSATSWKLQPHETSSNVNVQSNPFTLHTSHRSSNIFNLQSVYSSNIEYSARVHAETWHRRDIGGTPECSHYMAASSKPISLNIHWI